MSIATARQKVGLILLAVIVTQLAYIMAVPGDDLYWVFSSVFALDFRENLSQLRLILLTALVALECLTALLLYQLFCATRFIRVISVVVLVLNYQLVQMLLRVISDSRQIFPSVQLEEGSERFVSLCSIDQAALAIVRKSVDPSLEQAGQSFVVSEKDKAPYLLVLRMPECQIALINIPYDQLNAPPIVSPDGFALFEKGANEWFFYDATSKSYQAIPLIKHMADESSPALSADGQWMAWIQRIPAPEKRAAHTQSPDGVFVEQVLDDFNTRILLRRTLSKEQHIIELRKVFSDQHLGNLRLLGFDLRRSELVVSLGDGAFASVGLDGKLRWGPLRPRPVLSSGEETSTDEIEVKESAFLSLFNGWVSWGREVSGKFELLFWELPRGTGKFKVAAKRAIHSVAVSGDGKYLGFALRAVAGAVGDEIRVLRVRDGEEIFKKRFVRDSFPRVAFLGDDFFAYSARLSSGENKVFVYQIKVS